MTGPFWKPTLWLPVMLLMVGLLLVGCRNVEPAYQNVPPAAGEADSPADSHVFQVGDRVQIRQLGIDGVTTEIRIEKDGTITLHDIGAITVTNKTAVELQEELKALYGKYYKNMRLWIGPCPINRIYYVGGEVRTPGPKAYLGKTTVSMAIQAAGDFTKFANKKKVVLTRPNDHRETVNVVKAVTNPSLDLPVYPGDVIFVKQRGYWFQKVPIVRWEGSSEADY